MGRKNKKNDKSPKILGIWDTFRSAPRTLYFANFQEFLKNVAQNLRRPRLYDFRAIGNSVKALAKPIQMENLELSENRDLIQ